MKATFNPADSPDFQRLKSILQKMPDGTLERLVSKSERIQMLVTPSQKDEIRLTAESYGLTVTDFITRCMSIVMDVLRERAGK